MAVYNGELYIYEAVLSVLSQDFINFEFIIIDDCSTDNTAEIIQGFNDDRIKYFLNKENIGQTKSLNIGIKKSIGKYIARVDADDLFYPEKLSKQFNYMESHPEIAACGTGSVKIDDVGEKVGLRIPPVSHDEIISTMLYRSPMIHVSILMRRKCIISLNGYNEKYPICADYDLWSRLVRNGYKLANIPDTLTSHRLLQNSTGNKDFLGNAINEVAEIIHNYWLKYVKISITFDQCRDIALIRRPESGLTITRICNSFKLIIDARKKINVDWRYFDKINIDIYKLLLWGVIKNNNYRKSIEGTSSVFQDNLSLLTKNLFYPRIFIIIILSMLFTLFPNNAIKLIKSKISS